MNVQYVSDEQGRQTDVVISIEDWKRLLAKYDELNEPEKPKKKPSDFRGTISSELADALLKHVEQARNEWDTVKPPKKASDFVGLLTSDETDKYHTCLEQARSEWDRDI